MTPTPKDRIAQRAYAIWEQEGRPNGRHADHWLRAEIELGVDKLAPAREAAAAKAVERRPDSRPLAAAAAQNRPARLTKGPNKPGRR